MCNKTCFTCDHCCCTDHDEDSPTAEFWCETKKIEFNKTGALNSGCKDWIIKDDSN
jgi:hypothetical protein